MKGGKGKWQRKKHREVCTTGGTLYRGSTRTCGVRKELVGEPTFLVTRWLNKVAMHAQGRAARACKNWWIFFNHPDGANTLFTDPGDAAANVLTGSESSTWQHDGTTETATFLAHYVSVGGERRGGYGGVGRVGSALSTAARTHA
eukprot:1190330-Prorocentrum_minimum.AAC.5